VFENKALKRIFGPMTEVTRERRVLDNKELHFVFFHKMFRVMKSRRMRWVGNMACMGMRNAHEILVRKPEGKRPLGGPGVDTRILK
jgi:hypothetical protein